MTVPLIRTSNTNRIDYGTSKSAGYTTSTGKYHRYIPSVPQYFDRRAKLKLDKNLLESDSTLNEETYKTIYGIEYPTKRAGDCAYVPRAIPSDNVNYLRCIQEKLFKEPPVPSDPNISVTKNDYQAKYSSHEEKQVYPPAIDGICQVKPSGRDDPRPIQPEKGGYYRLLDPYMTTNRLSHVAFTRDQQDGIARKDIITYYDATGVPRGGKGYGPKNNLAIKLPIFRAKNEKMHDKLKFKDNIQDKIVPSRSKMVPNFGMQSEYRARYVPQTFSDFYPLLHSTAETFPDSMPDAGAWQILTPPGMYCTEYRHLNSGWPVRCVIDQDKPVERIEHDLDLCRLDFSSDSNDLDD